MKTKEEFEEQYMEEFTMALQEFCRKEQAKLERREGEENDKEI